MADKPAPISPGANVGEADKAGGTAMLWIGCKLPNGLLCELGKIGDDNYTAVQLNGANSTALVGGYGLTPVSQSFWEAWKKKNKHLPFLRGANAAVFDQAEASSAAAQATEMGKSVKTGMEPINPFEKVKDKAGNVLLEVDADHFKQGQREVARLRSMASGQG